MARTTNHIASRVDRTRIHQSNMLSGEIADFSVDFTSPLLGDNIQTATWRCTGGQLSSLTTTNKRTGVKFQATAGSYALDVLATTEAGNKLRQGFYVQVQDSGFVDSITSGSDTLTTDPLAAYISPTSLSAINVPFDNTWRNVGAPITAVYAGGVGGWSFVWNPTLTVGNVRAVAQNTQGSIVQIQASWGSQVSTSGTVSVTVRDDGGNQVIAQIPLSVSFGNPV